MTVEAYLARLTAIMKEHMAIMAEAQKLAKHRNLQGRWDAHDMVPRGNNAIRELRKNAAHYQGCDPKEPCNEQMLRALAYFEDVLKDTYKRLEYVRSLTAY